MSRLSNICQFFRGFAPENLIFHTSVTRLAEADSNMIAWLQKIPIVFPPMILKRSWLLKEIESTVKPFRRCTNINYGAQTFEKLL